MKKQLLLFVMLFFAAVPVWASHVIGGEMIYEFLGVDPVTKFKNFRITLRLFRDEHCGNCALMPPNVYIGIFRNDTRAQYPGTNIFFDVPKSDEGEVTIVQPPCILNAPELDYHYAKYTFTTSLPDNANGYTASYQTCCRVAPLQNVENDPDGNRGTGSTYACFIPGTTQLTATDHNSSPQFTNSISTLCAGKKFSLNFSATDPDGDVLTYSFSNAYNGGRTIDPRPINPDPPAYNSVHYISGYTGAMPLGTNAQIGTNTGIITGIAPPLGDYIVSVDIAELRGGKRIGLHRKDFIVNVSDCDVAGAALKPGYAACDGFNYTFENLNNSPLNKSFLWDFGDGEFSTEEKPTHAFRDTGVYNIKLIVNEDNECGESATSEINVFPGFFPEFTYSECSNNPTLFKDLTQTAYGVVNSWSWTFGEEGDSQDTSHARNPSYTYGTTGKKGVTFIVTNSKGCEDTVNREILVLGNATAGRDTSVVVGQTLQLGASEGASFTWLPATDLSDARIQNPVGIYNGTYDSIRYKVLIFNEPDCLDSAFITVHIYKTAPAIFVPTAFTPNSDGRNDVLRPVAAGITKIEYFRVYNRWGQQVFTTTIDGHGWDGKLKGKEQPTGTFVWLVKGLDYLGKSFFAKGTVMLIR
ncbi:MAG TPA: PKD domain-containing protein [Chitinophagaceae bacterium]|nr:PKD domain-containing protein [Chitinophagaceae bacterium]